MATTNIDRDRPCDPTVHLIEGTVVGRRSMGRRLAFADIALSPSHASFKVDHLKDCAGGSSRSGGTGDDESDIKVTFSHQAFLGPSPGVGQDSPSALDAPFPTKRTSLPYGAHVVVQLALSESCHDGRKHLCEVLRWKIKTHPREEAARSAALDADEQGRNGRHRVTLGSGALSNTLYLKARREAFERANRRKTRVDEAEGGRGVVAGVPTDSAERLPSGALPGNPEDRGDPPDARHGGTRSKAFRARVFAAWVLDTFFRLPAPGAALGGLDCDATLCHPCGSDAGAAEESPLQRVRVLDIAGGKGQLSLELMLQQMAVSGRATGLSSSSPPGNETEGGESPRLAAAPPPISHCTIIDPVVRKGDARRRHAKLARARSRGERSQRRGELRAPHEGSMSPNWDSSAPRQNVDDGKGGNACHPDERPSRDASDGAAIDHLAAYFTARTFPQLYSQCISPTGGPPAAPAPTAPHLANGPQRRQDATALLLGLHPDECTEDILDVALEHDLPVAIVPCCVFADLFPSRKMAPRNRSAELANDSKESGNDSRAGTPNGDSLVPVRTYADFLQYLLDKDTRLKIATLPFEGRNKVIYRKIA